MWFALLTAGIIDLKKRIIPNTIVLLIFVSAFWNHVSTLERLAGLLLPALPLFLLALKFKNINGGDIKYLAALGFYFGLTNLASILVFTTVIAFLWAVVKKEKSVPLAFITFLGFAVWNILK